jgi:Peptidase S46
MRVHNALATATLLLPSLLGCGSPIAKRSVSAPQPQPEVVQPQVPAEGDHLCDPTAQALPPPGEGMWPWHDLAGLDENALNSRGLQISLADLWTPGKGGLLRAVAGLKGCSASFVSSDGLLLTNHHCAYPGIQRNSSPEHDYLANGFVAKDRSEELPGRGMLVYVFQQQSDVTAKVLDGLDPSLPDLERLREIERRESALVKACEQKPNTRCEVARENHGLRFLLLENLELRDVRIVAAPPESLGNFGGEIDNWHWPRHTLDFTLMRAYVNPKGEPADYDKNNVAFRPERYLQVSTEFPAPPDFIMVAGTPARTKRYATAVEVEDALTWYYPTREALFAAWIAALEAAAGDDPKAVLATASWVRRLNNGLFHAKGMVRGLRANRTVDRAKAREETLRAWMRSEPTRMQQYGSTLDALETHLKETRDGRDRDLLLGYLTYGAQVFSFARRITKWAAERDKPDERREPGYQDRDEASTGRELEQAQRSLHLDADRAVMKLFVQRLCQLSEKQRPLILAEPNGLPCDEARLDRRLRDLYRRTKLGEVDGRKNAFGKSLDVLRRSADPMIRLALQMAPELDAVEQRGKERAGARVRLERPYLEALIAFQGKTFYPDANGTPRISFAHVSGYSPQDGTWYTPQTTFRGLLDKHTGKKPFDAPEALRRAFEQRSFGAYADASGEDVPMCFLSNADTTGGNSGSPVLDARGRVIGLNFDRVYENIAGDYGYNPARSRNVMVSTRAILWYLEQVAGAGHVAAEMKGR